MLIVCFFFCKSTAALAHYFSRSKQNMVIIGMCCFFFCCWECHTTLTFYANAQKLLWVPVHTQHNHVSNIVQAPWVSGTALLCIGTWTFDLCICPVSCEKLIVDTLVNLGEGLHRSKLGSWKYKCVTPSLRKTWAVYSFIPYFQH